MKTTVIYHSADFDGIFCREIAKKFLPDAELIGWNHGDPLIPYPMEGTVYVLDLSPDCLGKMPDGCQSNLVWIDHHKSSIDKWPASTPGYRIDGVAACRLAWQWFNLPNAETKHNAAQREGYTGYPFPTKERFIDRKVSEPLAVRLAGEYDIWDKRDPRAELFQHGLRSRDLTGWWDYLLTPTGRITCTIDELEKMLAEGKKPQLLPDGTVQVEQSFDERIVEYLLRRGEAIQYSTTRQNESIIKAAGFTLEFEGLKFLACNHARYNSHLFAAGLKPEHDACFGFAWRDGQWAVSLYHAPGKEHHDLSQIAVKYGGGGHRGACGFRIKTLPFLA